MTPPWYLAASLKQLRAEIDARWPDRSRASDGTNGNAAHAKTKSDHNPDPVTGVVRAFDITEAGIDHRAVRARLIGHPAVEYVINDGTIWSRVREFKPRPYTGLNAHKTHIHVSIRHTREAESWAGRWLPAPREDDMPLSDADLQKIASMVELRANTAASRVLDGLTPRIEDIVTQTVNALLAARIETYHDKDGDRRRDVETVAQALGGAHSDAWFSSQKLDRVVELLTALRDDARAGEKG